MSFKAVLEADIKGFSNSIDKAIGSVDKLEKTTLQKLSKVGDSFVKIGAKASIFSTAVVGATVGLVKMGVSAGDASADINNLSTATSLSTDLIQELSYVASASNSSFEGLRSSMDSFQRRLKTVGEEGSRVNEMFGRLGVSTTDASGNVRSMDDVLLDTFNKLGDMEEGLAKNAIGAELFGRRWNEVALIVSSGSKGIAELRKEANKLGLVLDENTLQSSDDFSTAMGLVRFQIDTLKTKIGASLVPILEETVLPLLQDKVIPAVSRFADKLSKLITSFNELSTPTKNTIILLTGIATAIGPVLLGLGGLLKILPLIKVAITALTGPVGIVVTAIVAGTALIIENWDKLKAASNNVVDALISDWDYMADHFKTVSASIGKVIRGDFAGWWDDVKKTFDTNIDYLKTKWQQLKGIFKEPITAEAGMAIGGIGQALNSVAEEAEVAAVELDKFIDAAEEIEELDTFQKLIGEQLNVRDAVNKTTSTIEDLQSKLVKLQLGILPSTNVRQEIAEIQQQINDLLAVLDLLTGKRELNIDIKTNISGIEAAENKFFKDGKFALPPIDTSALDASMGDLSQKAQAIEVTVGDVLGNLFADASTAIMEGDNVMTALASSMLGMLGGIMVDLGKMALGIGIGLEKIQKALMTVNPVLATAAGVALIALGSLFSAGSRKLASSMGGDGGGYSSAPSLRNTSPGYAPSEYRGAYQDDFVVTFKIGNDELVGTLDTAQQRRRRL